jgi:uncharacterized membrane-anchored protein
MEPHHHHLIERMAEKGWSEEELQHAYDVLEEKKNEKHFLLNYLDRPLHWLLFFVIVLGNIAVAAVIVPLLVIFPNPGLYGILILLGAGFGLLCEIVVKHIDHQLSLHHHFMLGVVIPFLAIISTFLVTGYADTQLPSLFGIEHNPVAFGIIYGVAFALPYLITKFIDISHWLRT